MCTDLIVAEWLQHDKQLPQLFGIANYQQLNSSETRQYLPMWSAQILTFINDIQKITIHQYYYMSIF